MLLGTTSRFMPRRSHAHRLLFLGNLTDDRRKIERAPPGSKIPRTVAGEHAERGFNIDACLTLRARYRGLQAHWPRIQG